MLWLQQREILLIGPASVVTWKRFSEGESNEQASGECGGEGGKSRGRSPIWVGIVDRDIEKLQTHRAGNTYMDM